MQMLFAFVCAVAVMTSLVSCLWYTAVCSGACPHATCLLVQVFLQAVIFAGSHLSAGDLVPLTALGVCLGTVTVAAEGNLLAPILAHALYNGAILYVIVR